MRLYREVVEHRLDESFRAWTHGYPFKTVKWHFHPEYEIHLITATTGQAFVGDHVGRFAPGNLTFLGPNLPHNWISEVAPGESVPQRCLVLQFGEEFITGCMTAFPELRQIRPLLAESTGGLEYAAGAGEAAMAPMTALLTAHGPSRLELFFGLMRLLVASPRRRLSSPQYRPGDGDTVHRALEHVLLHIERNSHANIRESDMAALSGYTQSSFARAFRRLTGRSFTHYVNEKRIARSCDLLLHCEDSITAICFAVGFNNISNFNRQFLHHRGLAPSAWRRAHRQQAAHAA